jgi:pre-mRNA-processing factor 17
MDYLQYGSSDDEEANNKSTAVGAAAAKPKAVIPPPKRMTNLHPAPQPSTLATLQLATRNQSHLNATSTSSQNNKNYNNNQLMTNPLKSQLLQPIQGPTLDENDNNGYKKPSLSKGKIALDITQNTTFDYTTFDMQRNSFQRDGIAIGPNDGDSANRNGGVIQRGTYGHGRKVFNKETNKYEEVKILDDRFANKGEQVNTAKPKSNKRKRKSTSKSLINDDELINDEDDELNYGIWGPPTSEMKEIQNDQLSTLDKVGGVIDSLPLEIQKEREHLVERDRRKGLLAGNGNGEGAESRENQNFDKLVERKMSHLLPPRMNSEEAKAIEPTTKLHLSADEEHNYKNESWIVPPTDLRESVEFGDVDHHKCYVPKKCTARFLGHNKGVHRIRLSPGTGHLLLSGGLDGKCKVWNILTKKVCRTYIGHSAAVRDVQFNNDGTKFLSCSFDRFIRLWDTESGKVLGTYTNRRVPYVIKFYPLDDNTFVVGCSDNKIVAYDSTSGEITQEYNHHLAPVNTITFVEDHGMKMITSSDDKKILVWEWDIGVPIKYISDPTMHSIPVVTLHPTGGYFVGQSLDNQIVVYQGRDRFAVQRKKKFSGHLVSGYACDIAISPDGQFVCSGDGNGKLFFWDWRRTK